MCVEQNCKPSYEYPNKRHVLQMHISMAPISHRPAMVSETQRYEESVILTRHQRFAHPRHQRAPSPNAYRRVEASCSPQNDCYSALTRDDVNEIC